VFYRVDYVLAVLLAGFLAGALFNKAAQKISASRLARAYYIAVVVLLILRAVTFTGLMVTAHPGWNTVGKPIGDLGGLLFGALFGLAVRRRDARQFLVDPDILAALTLTIGFTFVMAALGKAFSMTPMTEFFAQSGYSIAFLKFIVIAEAFGGLGLLLPWAFVPAVSGLTIDMFGAVLTHIHNGDPLNDSSGAIGLLIRLAVLAILWTMRPHEPKPARSLRASIARVATIGVVCLLIAFGGASQLRHAIPIASPANSSAH
jgi:hypothetical protein